MTQNLTYLIIKGLMSIYFAAGVYDFGIHQLHTHKPDKNIQKNNMGFQTLLIGNPVSSENKPNIKRKPSTSTTKQSPSVINHWSVLLHRRSSSSLCVSTMSPLWHPTVTFLTTPTSLPFPSLYWWSCSGLGLKRYPCGQTQRLLFCPQLSWPLSST